MSASPYSEAMAGRLDTLHPRLLQYFSTIPDGFVGSGRGTFDVVGTPRRWLWPVLAMLAGGGILFPVWQTDVPFEIENRQTDDGLRARRVFHLVGGDRVMVDRMRAVAGRLVDALGTRGALRAGFDANVDDGALVLRSNAVGLRVGRAHVSLPAVIRPRVTLVERIDGSTERQHVALTIDLPVIGRIYEYSGSFDYEVRAKGEQ
ncbi:DUF4166 domain-containing protein [Orlajensenia flava]|nr:DUF4166 domain-containing protein [Glaciibacter flavus]